MMHHRQSSGRAVSSSPCPLASLSTPRRGAAAAELAILLPFLGLMFVVAVDFCRVFAQTQTLDSCARSAALYASGTVFRAPGTDAAEAAKQAAVTEGTTLNPPLTADAVTVVIGPSEAAVTVTYPFQTFTSYPGLPGTLTLSRTVRMPVAPRPPGATW